MNKLLWSGWLAGIFCFATTGALAGFDEVKYPEGYQTQFVRYATIDNAKKKKVRFFYVNPEALAAAKPGKPLPDGTVIIMEDHPAVLDANDMPIKNKQGRLIPTSKITNVFVQERRKGWGALYPENIRNGEWEYAWYTPDGKPKVSKKTGKLVTFQKCMACHQKVAAQDYNFTLSPFVAKIKETR